MLLRGWQGLRNLATFCYWSRAGRESECLAAVLPARLHAHPEAGNAFLGRPSWAETQAELGLSCSK